MSDVDADDAIEALATATRMPRQKRSRESLERMLKAAEQLLAERGTEEFTLLDVAREGKVSIGSIYCRFDGKDELVRAVQTRVLAEVEAEQIALAEQVASDGERLHAAVALLVEGLAESLKRFAPVMRPIMQRANTDVLIAATGKKSYGLVANHMIAALLRHGDEIRRADGPRAASSVFRVVYSAIARYLGFASSAMAAGEGDWAELKADLADMAYFFLVAPDGERRD
jgi:AcrR family transcriptional regulator